MDGLISAETEARMLRASGAGPDPEAWLAKRRDLTRGHRRHGVHLRARADAAEILAAVRAVPSDDLDRLWVKRDDAIRPELDIRFRSPDTRDIDRDGLLHLSWFWRDIKDHQRAVWVDPRLFDLLSRMPAAAASLAGTRQRVHPALGLSPTPERNRTLEKGLPGGRCTIQARAADITLPGFSPAQIGALAAVVGAGGIGLYDRFTHVDTGSPRAWGVAANRPGDHHG